MFVLIPLIRLLAQHVRGWVLAACGAALLAAGIGVAAAGLAAHQPIVTRTGILILAAAAVFATIATRARRSRNATDQGQPAHGQTEPENGQTPARQP